jgi:hypothetical protein
LELNRIVRLPGVEAAAEWRRAQEAATEQAN